MPKATLPVQVRFKDLDGLGHVNNAVYLTYLEQARMQYFQQNAGARGPDDFQFILAHCSIDFKAPIRLDSRPEVHMWTSRVGGKSWDFDYEIIGERSRTVYATAKTVQVAYDYQLEKSARLEGDLRARIKELQP